MGLQVPSTSYLKPVGSLVSGKPLRKKEDDRDDELQGKQVFKRPNTCQKIVVVS